MFRRELKDRRNQRLDMDIGQAELNQDTIQVLEHWDMFAKGLAEPADCTFRLLWF